MRKRRSLPTLLIALTAFTSGFAVETEALAASRVVVAVVMEEPLPTEDAVLDVDALSRANDEHDEWPSE